MTEEELSRKTKTLRPEIQFGLDLAKRIVEKVRPVYGIKQTDVPINQISKDYNYVVDQVAEDEIRQMFKEAWGEGKMYGFVTEDQGLVLPPAGSELIFMIDPVDGSRPAQIGAEMATVTMVAVPGEKGEATFADVKLGVTHTIKEDVAFFCEKGTGINKIEKGRIERVKPRENIPITLKDVSMVHETYSVSAQYDGVVMDSLLAAISFETRFPSGSYSALTLVRGQNELHVDLRRRLIDEFPELPIAYKSSSKALSPMDIAAGWLMIQELGGKVTNAYGNPLDERRLWAFDSQGAWSSEN